MFNVNITGTLSESDASSLADAIADWHESSNATVNGVAVNVS